LYKTGFNAADCTFKSNAAGAVRLSFKPTVQSPQMTFDFNVAPCGDGECSAGETCSFCPQGNNKK
jgi:hypothetical protein